MDITISIIIAVYNCRQYIRRCIGSVVGQLPNNYELIIVDDGSTDGTSEICDEYCNWDKITVIHQWNQGHSSARKRGLRESKGDYIFFLDADDWVTDDFLSKINMALQNASITPDVIAFNYNRVNEEGESRGIKSDFKPGTYEKADLANKIYPFMLYDSRKEFYSFGLFPTLWSKVFRKGIITEVMNMLDEKVVLGEDSFCVFLSLYRSDSLLILDEYLYNYQINSQSLSRKYAQDNFERLHILCNLMDNEYPKELETQVRQYKLLMFMGAITNETRGPKKTRDIIQELKYRSSQDTFKDCIKNVEVIHMPIMRRLFLFLLKAKLYGLLIYSFRILKA